MKEKQKTMASVQMYEALVERAAIIGRFEVYSSLRKVICKHVEKLQSRMKTLLAVNAYCLLHGDNESLLLGHADFAD